ncbi:MAG: Rpn family recombination-promoting nuclease/putative transposase [Myxococcota bacterium]
MTDKPHDRYVKRLLQRPEIAADILRFVLPEALAAALDLASIESAGTEFVDDRLQQIEPDIVLKMQTVSGAHALLFVVLEHQSSVDPWMAYRMSRNTMRVWESWRAKTNEAMRLPVVIPVVLYHGDAPWRAETNIGELIDGAGVRDAMGELWPSFGYVVEWVNAHTEDELRASGLKAVTQLMLLALAQARGSENMVAVFARWAGLFADVIAQTGGTQDIELTARYFIEVRDIEDLEMLQVEAQLLDPRVKESVMTAAEHLLQQGHEKGREEGRKEGIKEGRKEGIDRGRLEQQREMLRQALVKRFGDVPSSVKARISDENSLARLMEWTFKAFDAKTVESVFTS